MPPVAPQLGHLETKHSYIESNIKRLIVHERVDINDYTLKFENVRFE